MSTNKSSGPAQPVLPADQPTSEMRRHPLHPVHAVYAVAMLGASLAMVGPGGLFFWGPIVVTWACVFYRIPRDRGLREVLLIGGWLCFSCCLGLPFLSSARDAATRAECWYRLRQISRALHQYHDEHGSLPPAYLVDEDGRPMHSWRVLILPYMEQAELYSQYRFDEPWNGPNNRRLATQMPRLFACPSDQRSSLPNNTTTSYLAIVGPTTAWSGEHGRPLPELNDGGPNPLLIVESHSQSTEWMEPRDLDFDTAVQLFTLVEPFDDGHVSKGLFYDHHLGRNIALADGTCCFVPLISRESAESLLRIGNGRATPDTWPHIESAEEVWRPKYGNWLRFGVFLVLAFFPLPWVFRPGNHSGAVQVAGSSEQ